MILTLSMPGRISLLGRRVTLEVAEPKHAEFFVRCFADDEFMDRYRLAQQRNIEVDKIHENLNNRSGSFKSIRFCEWVIRIRGSKGNEGELIGIASLADYEPHHHRAEFLIGLLHSDDLNSGLALEASLLVLEFAFHQAKLHKLISIVYAFNQVAQKNTLHLGFSQEAVFREHYLNPRNGKYIDLYQNGLLKSDFFESKNISRWSKRLLGRDITKKREQKLKVDCLSKGELDKQLDLLVKSRRLRQD